VALYGPYALANLSCDNKKNRKLISSNGVDRVLNSMKKFPDNSKLQEYCCLALGNLCAENEVKIIRAAGFDLILSAMSKNTENNEIMYYGCTALASLLAIEVSAPTLMKYFSTNIDGVNLIVTAIKRLNDFAGFLEVALLVLGNLALSNDLNTQIEKSRRNRYCYKYYETVQY